MILPICNPTSNEETVPLSPNPCQHLLSLEILILAILTGVRWNLRVVLICFFLMIKDVEHFLGASQPFGIPQLRILCLAMCHIFKMWLFDFSGVQLLSSLYILNISPLSDLGLVKILAQSVVTICLIDSVLCLTEALQFHEVPFVDS